MNYENPELEEALAGAERASADSQRSRRNRTSPQPKLDPGLLADVYDFVGKFVAYPSEHGRVAHVLWIAHTHAMDAWESTPRLAFLSPEPASGKTRALEVSELLVPNAVDAVNVSPAYLFRKVGDDEAKPTILYDEVDTVFGPKAKENEEIRGLINAGHRRGAVAGRCVVHGKTVKTEEIPAYCAVALAGLGWLPNTILTRSIIIRMRRRASDETVMPFRRRVHAPEGHALRERLAAWSAGLLAALTAARPQMPPGIEDRNADMWESLFAIADAAGGDWPKRVRAAAVALVAVATEAEPSLGIRLLADMRTVFDQARAAALPTTLILTALIDLPESPWGDLKGKPITDRALSTRLRQYGIRSKSVRIGDRTAKGYAREDFHDTWVRYLPFVAGTVTSGTSGTSTENSGFFQANVPESEPLVTDSRNGKGPRNSKAVPDMPDVPDLRWNGGQSAITVGGGPPIVEVDPGDDFLRRCDYCGRLGASGHWNWRERPDGIWLHPRCEEAWYDTETAISTDKQPS